MFTGGRVTNHQPPMLQAVLVQAREDRRATMAQFISPAVAAVNGELVGHLSREGEDRARSRVVEFDRERLSIGQGDA
jgi:hypothetical protein